MLPDTATDFATATDVATASDVAVTVAEKNEKCKNASCTQPLNLSNRDFLAEFI